MKALVLAAGFGTRLLPYTSDLPKPLFSIGGRTLLDRVVDRLGRAGCDAIAVNTHHLSDQIAAHLARTRYPVPVTAVRESVLLGTGGAVLNLLDFWDERPFFVVNSDILFDADLKAVYDFHLQHDPPATLVLTDDPEFNMVRLRSDGTIAGFAPFCVPPCKGEADLTFTGIQVLSPHALSAFPTRMPCCIIDAYRRLLAAGKPVMGYRLDSGRWQDLGAVQRFRKAAMDIAGRKAFEAAFPGAREGSMTCRPLCGDGSDRRWYRLESGEKRLVVADHGIQTSPARQEIDSFVDIGRHLQARGVAVPRIHHAERFAGLVFLADLGDRHLQTAVLESDTGETMDLYRRVIQEAMRFWLAGEQGFDLGWTCQTPRYTADVILDKECRYFMEAFVRDYRRLPVGYEILADEFRRLAERIQACAEWALMHRDCQSRNIMIHAGRPFFIDFQGARIGPIQYDLASLMIDPYVNLAPEMQGALVRECLAFLSNRRAIDLDRFLAGYRYCAISRNLQILGAFAFLSRVREKPVFETYIPAALESLVRMLSEPESACEFPKLSRLACDLISG